MPPAIRTWRADPALPGVHLLRLVPDEHSSELAHVLAALRSLPAAQASWDAARECFVVRAAGVPAVCRLVPELADLVMCGAEVSRGQIIHAPARRRSPRVWH